MPEHSVKVIGVGSSGCDAIVRMAGCTGCDLVGVHTDARDLLEKNIPIKILIGRQVTKGRSTGNDITLGERAAVEDIDKIAGLLDGSSLVYIIAALGGGTGAGASPILAQAAKNTGSTVVAIVNTPFVSEGKACLKNARDGLMHLRPFCDLIIVLEGDRFLKIVPNLSIRDAFVKVNNILLDTVKGMIKLINDSGVENIKPLLSGYATIGHGFGEELPAAVEAALNSPLISSDTTKSQGIFLYFTTDDKKLEGLNQAMEAITKKTNAEAKILWSNIVDEKAKGVEALVLFSGVANPVP